MRAGNEKTGNRELILPVAAGVEITEGTLVTLGADGYAKPAAAAKDLITAGVAQAYVDNRLGKKGEEQAWVRRGAFVLNNDGSIANTDILKQCYIVDAQTVSVNADVAAASSVAGIILSVADDGVVVDTMFI